MFDRLFPRHQTRERHITSPLFQERLDYLQHCAEKGYAPTTLRPLATDLLLIQNLLGLPESSQKLEPATVRAAIDKWAAREPKYFSHKNGRRGRENLPQRAIRRLLYMDRIQISRSDTSAYSVFIEDFAGYMRQQRGLSEETIKGRSWCVEDFLRWFFRDHRSLSDITIAEIDEGIARKGRDQGYARRSVKVYASGIRTFFRHAERKGWCRRGLADVIESPRVYQYEGLPSGPSWDDVQRVIATTEGGRPKDLREEAPIQPLRGSSAWTIVAKRLRPLGLPLRQHGPHALRHACATRLLAEGLSLKEIGDHLGHRAPKVTAVYAKVDITGLREVANSTLGDLV